MFLALAGGVGGAKLALGLTEVLAPEELMIVVNIGDDFDHLGLRICPDIDTVLYSLGGIANPETGWGQADETWNFMAALERLGGESWFRLGDRDLATHVERTRRLQEGENLSAITADFAGRLGIRHPIVPATDGSLPTIVRTHQGDLAFQEYFVRQQCAPTVTGFDFAGAAQAEPSAAISEAIESGKIEAVIICPSNPYVSIAPILAVPAISDFVSNAGVPAAKMMSELGTPPSALSIAEHYRAIATAIVVDTTDSNASGSIQELGLAPLVTNTVMKTDADKTRLAGEIIAFLHRSRDFG